MREIKVLVTPSGDLKVEAVGFQGRDCLAATAAVERALGRAGTRKLKPEAVQKVHRGVGRSRS